MAVAWQFPLLTGLAAEIAITINGATIAYRSMLEDVVSCDASGRSGGIEFLDTYRVGWHQLPSDFVCIFSIVDDEVLLALNVGLMLGGRPAGCEFIRALTSRWVEIGIQAGCWL